MGNEQMKNTAVITYHGINRSRLEGEWNGYNIEAAEFERQIRWLSKQGYSTLTLDDIIDGRGSGSGDGRKVVITFDDGEKNIFRYALPVMEREGFKSIVFVTTKSIAGNRYFMNWDELRKMHELGHSIQVHGHTHAFLNTLAETSLRKELELPRELLRACTGEVPRAFSCPGGRYDKRVVSVAQALGYKKMFTSNPRYYDPDEREGFSVGRFMVAENDDLEAFRKIIEGDQTAGIRRQMSYLIKGSLKRIVGDRAYQALFWLMKR